MDEEWLAYNSDDVNASASSECANTTVSQAGSANDSNFHESEDGEITIENVDFNAPSTPSTSPTPATTAQEVNPNKATIDEIKALAIIKLKVTEDMAFTKVMELTGLAIIPQNFEAIKKKLNEIA
jgi:hypothetical protein